MANIFVVVFLTKTPAAQLSRMLTAPVDGSRRARVVSAAPVAPTSELSEEARGSWKALFPRLFVPCLPSSCWEGE